MDLIDLPGYLAKAQKIKLIIFDVDGVFTDGRIYMDDNGIEIKAFHVWDGQGIKFLQKSPIQIGVISGRSAPGVGYRMQQLGIPHIYLGHTQKLPVYQALLNTLQFSDEQTAYVGDDLLDLPLLKRVGLPITVPNAAKEVLAQTPFVTQAKGGKGAVREICESLLKAQGYWQKILDNY